MRKSKELPLLMSLVLHIVGLTFALYLSSDSYELSERRTESISVSVIPVSEFDAQISQDPELLIQKFEFPKPQNFSDLTHDDLKFYHPPGNDLEVLKARNHEIFESPVTNLNEFKRIDPDWVPKVKKEIVNYRDMGFEISIGSEQMQFISGPSSPKDLTLKDNNTELLDHIRQEHAKPHREVRFLKPKITHNKAVPGFAIPFVEMVSNYNREEVDLNGFEFYELGLNDMKISKLDSVNRPKIVSKSSVHPLIENPKSFQASIKNSTFSDNADMTGSIFINQESKEFSNSYRVFQRTISNNLSTQLINSPSVDRLSSLGASVLRNPETRDKNAIPGFVNPVEEPISSSWGSAIEQKVLSNLVYPKKARNNFLSGKVFLKLEIFSDGTILNVIIGRSSGHLILDKAAKAAVLRSHKLPAAPDDYPNKKFIFNLPVTFSV